MINLVTIINTLAWNQRIDLDYKSRQWNHCYYLDYLKPHFPRKFGNVFDIRKTVDKTCIGIWLSIPSCSSDSPWSCQNQMKSSNNHYGSWNEVIWLSEQVIWILRVMNLLRIVFSSSCVGKITFFFLYDFYLTNIFCISWVSFFFGISVCICHNSKIVLLSRTRILNTVLKCSVIYI